MMTLVARRLVLAMAVAFGGLMAVSQPAAAATGPETFVQANVNKGLAILNNKGISAEQRRVQFQQFILGLTDMRRIATFTLGQYKNSATPQERDQFVAAFQNYATAVYQSYFSKYTGQSLRVTGSQERAPGDTIVQTQLMDPNDHSGNQPLEVDFRVSGDNGKFIVIDFSVAGIWLAIEERDQFSSFLGQNGGDVKTLIKHLGDLAKTYR